MAIKKVDVYVSQILEDLENGFTWLKKDDMGYGSIQEKYGAKEQQIAMIRKHPKLKYAETTVTIFNVIDDTKDERAATTTTFNRGDAELLGIVPTVSAGTTTVQAVSTGESNKNSDKKDSGVSSGHGNVVSQPTPSETSSSADSGVAELDSFSAFANL